ncbi:hypothetical protein [Deinococcus sedimenti]|uniref:Uncharacterized protein n=1 Tax=Deinococcus sedimenti TaxID=1867090 RepID=A0ABQ2S2Z9_9DEIO|nr:hypothetical protein [Deinococcus sedimenti]GGR81117.1 hypothetical protein GCM10008960_05030 [Deinococcus sedimenti]
MCSRSSAEIDLTAEYRARVNPEVRVAISVLDRSSGPRIYRWSKVTYQGAAGGATQATAAARAGVARMSTELVRAYRAANPPMTPQGDNKNPRLGRGFSWWVV